MGLIESMRDALPDGYGAAILYVLFALLVLIAVLGMIRLIRGYAGGTFVVGGRNRRTRLAVMDATPVDARRRLVLVRRDDVEHLILIGGPTDLVVERDIRIGGRQTRHVEPTGDSAPPVARNAPDLAHARSQARPAAPAARPAEPPRPVEPVLPPRPVQARGSASLPRPAIPMPAPPEAPRAAPAAPTGPTRPFEFSRSVVAAPRPAPSLPPANSLDDALLNELAISLEDPEPAPEIDIRSAAPRRTDNSLDEQMNKLLGEISRKK